MINITENTTYEHNTGDVLPNLSPNDVGTNAYNVDTGVYYAWDGAAWVVTSVINPVLYKPSTDTYKLQTTKDGQTQDLGQEVFFNAQNDTADSATELNPKVWLAGDSISGDESFFSILKPVANDLTPNSQIGINTTDIDPSGGKGKIVVFGEVEGVDTSAWGPGAKLYVDPTTPGELTSTPPTPTYFVAEVKKQDAVNGILFVNTLATNPIDTLQVPVDSLRAWFTGDIAQSTDVITNGNFESGTGWTFGTGWTLGSNEAVSDGSIGNLFQDIPSLVPGADYKVKFTTSGLYVSSGLVVYLGSNSGQATAIFDATYEYIITAGVDSTVLSFGVVGAGNFIGTITDIEVSQQLPFYTTSVTDSGTVSSVSQDISVNDNQTDWIATDTLGVKIGEGEFSGQVNGQVEFKVSSSAASQQILVELYKAEEDGTLIDIAPDGVPGSYGINAIVILTSPILNVDTNFTFFAPVSGYIEDLITLGQGERGRFRIGASKIGTSGASNTFTIFQGADHDTFLFIQSPLAARGVSYSNSNSDLAAANVQEAIDELDDEIVRWRPDYVSGDQVGARTMVYQDGWLMISNKATNDPAAPQPLGSVLSLYPDTMSWAVKQFAGVVLSGVKLTMLEGGWFKKIEVWPAVVTSNVNYRVITYNLSTGATTIYTEPVLVGGAWSFIISGNVVVPSGTQFIIVLDMLNSGYSVQFDGGWNSNTALVVPAAQTFSTDDFVSTLRVDKTDLDGADRTSELLSVSNGSTILINEAGDVSRSVTLQTTGAPVAGGSYIEYPIIEVDQGNSLPRNNRVCFMDYQVPTNLDTDYNEIENYWESSRGAADGVAWPVYADVEGYLELNGAVQVKPRSAFGVNFDIQRGTISPDWDVASTDATVSGSGGGIPSPVTGGIKYFTTKGVALADMSTNYVDISPDFGAGKTVILHDVIMRPIGGTVGSVDVRLIVTNISLGSEIYIIKEYTLLQGSIYVDPANVIQFRETTESGAGLMFNTENFIKIHTNDAITGWDAQWDITIAYSEIT